eukprot:g584.t1
MCRRDVVLRWVLIATAAWISADVLRECAPAYDVYVGYRAPADVQKRRVDILREFPAPEDFFQSYTLKRRPALVSIPGGVPSHLGWKTHLWEKRKYLIEKVGADAVVAVEAAGKDDDDDDDDDGSNFILSTPERKLSLSYRLVRWSKLLDKMMANEKVYLNLQDFAVSQELAEERCMIPPVSFLAADFSVPPVATLMPLHRINMWMGNASNASKSALHYDDFDNFYVVLRGRKSFTIFSPADTPRLYPVGQPVKIEANGEIRIRERSWWRSGGDLLPHFSYIQDTAVVDPKVFPKFAGTRQINVEVQAGEMLFLPAGWWHQVTSFGDNVALNFWTEKPDELVEEAHAEEVSGGGRPSLLQLLSLIVLEIECTISGFMNHIYAYFVN